MRRLPVLLKIPHSEYRRSRTSYAFSIIQSADRCLADGEGGTLCDVMPLGCPLANTRCGVEKIVVVASMDVLAGGNRIGYTKVFRDEGRGATTRYRPQEVPRFASGRSADRTSRCRKSHRQRHESFGSARLCAVPLDLLPQACLLYDSLSSWGA